MNECCECVVLCKPRNILPCQRTSPLFVPWAEPSIFQCSVYCLMCVVAINFIIDRYTHAVLGNVEETYLCMLPKLCKGKDM